MAQHKRMTRPPIGGLLALLVLGVVVAFPFVAESGCAQTSAASLSQPMELRGHWLGMGLAPTNSITARQLGVPDIVTGVVVAELPQDPASRPFVAGLRMGDVIVRVDGKSIADLAALFTLTTQLDAAQAIPVEILRRGQAMTLTLPPVPPSNQPSQQAQTQVASGPSPEPPSGLTQAQSWPSPSPPTNNSMPPMR